MVSSVGLGVGLGVGIGGLLALWHGLTYYEVDVKCEKPKYSVKKLIGKKKNWYGSIVPVAEIRQYAPFLMAEVELKDCENMRQALSSGFRQIAGFIFGKNVAVSGAGAIEKVAMTSPVTLETSSTSEAISMTSPVTAEEVDGSTYKVSFIMPSKYTKETLPKPLNDNVKIKEVSGHCMAALAFRGSSPSEDQMHQKADELRDVLQGSGYTAKGNVHLYQYHPPFAPAWMRRNEVLLEVLEDKTPAAS